MNETDINEDDFTYEEILQYLNEADEEYQEWNINLDAMIENLSDENKIFLSELSSKIGEKIFYLIYGYLNSESLIEYNEMSEGGISDFIDELDSSDTLDFIELLIDFKKQEIAETQEEVDYSQIIKKLKRDVATLKKKLEQPSKLINTKQFEERYGVSRTQQKGLRGKGKEAIPYSMLNQKTILYDPEEVDKWFENYKGRMKPSYL